MIHSSHPYWHVKSVVERRADIQYLTFSYYNYRPQTVEDNRIIWELPASEFTQPRIISEIIANTPFGHELALQSNMRLNESEERHLFMVDMSTSSQAHLEKLRGLVGEREFESIAWFKSGRSFHGYGTNLLTTQEWVRFMGLLLLANKPKMEPTVDPRWIGHRLIAGYSSLRWTKNSDYYILPPSLVKPPVT